MIKQLEEVTYPCYLICDGPERNFRTTHRGENPGVLYYGLEYSKEAVIKMIEYYREQYCGHPNEMKIAIVYIGLDDDGKPELKEVFI